MRITLAFRWLASVFQLNRGVRHIKTKALSTFHFTIK